jgi:methylenetetrahydrofolate reductase (NADPH)
MLFAYREMGIKRIVALRGDLPSGMGSIGEFQYANELVSFIRAQTGEHFHIEVAAYPEFHPQAHSPREDLVNFKRKVMAGADSAITQYFYNADAYFRLVDESHKLGVKIPIVPGIMPIVKFSQLARFSDACGAEIPRWMRKTLESYGDDSAAVQSFGLDVVTQLCEKLLAGGAPALHFYTLNQAGPVREICQRLAL